MRPSISVTLEPRLERGGPWGCDLYTFVTSAAGHMMRTLQKPRKNRPSKRQVNHRRFLHNMIQRKFADIEAANQRLASALYFSEEEKSQSPPVSQKPETQDLASRPTEGSYLQDVDECDDHADTGGVSETGDVVSVSSSETSGSKKQMDTGHVWKQHLKSQSTSSSTTESSHSEAGQKDESRSHLPSGQTSESCPRSELHHAECYNTERPPKSANNPEDPQTARPDYGDAHVSQSVDISSIFSPDLCQWPLDSHDCSVQTVADTATCSDAHKNMADISESQWTEIMDLLGACSRDLEACMDVEEYFESICAYENDAGWEVNSDDPSDGLTEKTCSYRSELEDLHSEAEEHRYGYSCQGDQGLTSGHFQNMLRQDNDAAETQPLNESSCHYSVSELHLCQRPHDESSCLLVNKQNFAPFEGVAQSFSAPLYNDEPYSIPTPPHEDDWLFSDILKDRNSPA
ncbi:uncharacterized protein V6R79_013302 [Siganus canaliculatus]